MTIRLATMSCETSVGSLVDISPYLEGALAIAA